MKKRTTTLPYFKFDTGRFLSDTCGFSAAHIGYYSLLMAHYWENEGDLPSIDALKRKLYVTSEEQAKILEEVINEFFPFSQNDYLDLCLMEVRDKKEQSAAAGRASAAARMARDTQAKSNDDAGNF